MPSHYSTDKTQEIVETFPDPDKKIIYKRTWSTSQREQRGKGLQHLKDGDWLMICFPPDSEVVTEKGTCKIQAVQLKDKILDHTGSFVEVENKFERDYKGLIYSILCADNSEHIDCTPQHKFLAIKGFKCKFRKYCVPSCPRQFRKVKKGKIYHTNCQKEFENYQISWIKAEELEEGDFLCYPLNRRKEKQFIKLKLQEFKYSTNSYENKYEITKDLMRLFGYYLAEGHCDKECRILFSLHEEEKKMKEDIINIMKVNFNLELSRMLRPKNSKGIQFGFSSVALRNSFKKWFGTGAHNKHFPSFFLNCEKQILIELFKGWMMGDGTMKNPDRISCFSASKELINQMQRLLYKFNIVAQIRKRDSYSCFPQKPQYSKKTVGYELNIGGSQLEILSQYGIIHTYVKKRRNSYQKLPYFLREDFIWIPVTKIETFKYRNKVYNLTTKSHSYVVGNKVVHNCDDDEIYKEQDLVHLRDFLTSQAKKDNYWIGSYTFINSFDWYRWITSPRLFRYKPGMAFTGSNSLTWNNGKKKYRGRITVPDVIRYHYSYVRNNRRLEIRQIQTAVNRYPYEKCGRFFTRKDIHPVGFTGAHPKIMQNHPYAKITWHPKLSEMVEGPHAKAKLPTERKKEPQKTKEPISKWEEFYKPFHRKDYEQHIEAWKGFCHKVAKFAPKRGKILEIGSGTGMMSIYLSKMGFYAIGLDNNSEMVRRAKNLVLEVGGKARFACHDLFNLDLKVVGSYHVVFSQGLLEHFTDSQIRKALQIQFKIAPIVVFSVPLDKFGHQSKGDERLLSDSFWRRMIAKYELLHFSKFAGESQIIVAIKRRG